MRERALQSFPTFCLLFENSYFVCFLTNCALFTWLTISWQCGCMRATERGSIERRLTSDRDFNFNSTWNCNFDFDVNFELDFDSDYGLGGN